MILMQLIHRYMESGGEGATVRPWVWILWLLVGPTINSITSQFNSYLAVCLLVCKFAACSHLFRLADEDIGAY